LISTNRAIWQKALRWNRGEGGFYTPLYISFKSFPHAKKVVPFGEEKGKRID